MDSNSSNDDDEPKICTVFSSTSSNSKSVFDTIAFSMPRKEVTSPSADPDLDPDSVPPASLLFSSTGASGSMDAISAPMPVVSKSGSLVSMLADDLQFGDNHSRSGSGTIPGPTTSLTSDNFTATETSMNPDPTSFSQPFMPVASSEYDQSLMTTPAGSTFAENVSFTVTSNPVFSESTGNVYNPQGFDDNIQRSFAPNEPTQDFPTETYNSRKNSAELVSQKLEFLRLEDEEEEARLPTAKSLFEDAPEVSFPVNIGFPYEAPGATLPTTAYEIEPIFSPVPVEYAPQTQTAASMGDVHVGMGDYPELNSLQQPFSRVSETQVTTAFHNYTPADASYDAWIPSMETQEALRSIQSGAYFPDTTRLITPAIVHEEDFVDKVVLNIGRIFGEGEASKRRILTADNVNQDDNGLRELIKLGCYRSALNLTKRLLTAYGQGIGKAGHYCKHSPHSLQLWFTRITLLVRIREFATAASEVEPFKDFDSVDMFYEFYGDVYGEGRKGSLAPFFFRLLAAEIPQYNRQFNETIDKLTVILITVQQILTNLDGGLTEDGSAKRSGAEQLDTSLKIWKRREIRVLYSLANASLFAKDYSNAFNVLTKLCRKDPEHEPQLKSAIARLFLQHGDLVSAQKYFQESSDLRSQESESEQVDTLIDSALAAISQSLYAEALSFYKQALLLQPENFTILNNMAVCLLYMGKLKESLALMETTVRQNTPQSLQENVLLNLSSIYELENTDGHKKHALLKLISEYKGDGVNLASLKLPNLV